MVAGVNVLEIGKHGHGSSVHQCLSVGLREPGGNPSFEERVPLSSVHESVIHSMDESVSQLASRLRGVKEGDSLFIHAEERKPVYGGREPFCSRVVESPSICQLASWAS